MKCFITQNRSAYLLLVLCLWFKIVLKPGGSAKKAIKYWFSKTFYFDASKRAHSK